MTVASEISRIENNIADAYTAAENKGATMPAMENSANLATCIGTITGGGGSSTKYGISIDDLLGDPSIGVLQSPSDAYTITLPNTITDVANYVLRYKFYDSGVTSVNLSSLTVVSGIEALSHTFQSCSTLTTINLSSLVSVTGYGAFDSAFASCNRLSSINLSSLATVSGESAFSSAFQQSGLTNISLPALITVSGDMAFSSAFQSCQDLATVNLSALTTISTDNAFETAFGDCTSLSSINLSSLATVSGYNGLSQVFDGCTTLTSIAFPALSDISGNEAFSYAFQQCTSLTSVSFPALTTDSFAGNTDTFMGMLWGTTGVTLHFPSDLQSTIEDMDDYPNFSGTNTVIAFDLPATS